MSIDFKSTGHTWQKYFYVQSKNSGAQGCTLETIDNEITDGLNQFIYAGKF